MWWPTNGLTALSEDGMSERARPAEKPSAPVRPASLSALRYTCGSSQAKVSSRSCMLAIASWSLATAPGSRPTPKFQ